jgi:hypothetical protein
LSENKWQIGPVKLANGEEAFIDAINVGQERYRYTGRMMVRDRFVPVGWHTDGRVMWATTDHPNNLAPPPKKKVRVRLCVNCYGGGAFHWYRSREDADAGQGFKRIACKEIDIEVEEGEGL